MNVSEEIALREQRVLGSGYDPDLKRCTKTVMDVTDAEIVFDDQGISNHYHEYQEAASKLPVEPERTRELESMIERIKRDGKSREYDCLIGLSGGVDSSYVAYLVHQWGLRPLAVHLDNGWNSELAVHNVKNIVTKLGFDLHTLVVNWDEFRDIQKSYIKASVVDIEVVSDHAIFSTMYKLAKEHNIRHILSGTNVVTEHIMPSSWLYSKMDYLNLKDIHNQYGSVKMKTYPTYPFWKYVYYGALLKLNPVSVLNYLDYNKQEAKEVITRELGWRDYGGKHYESTFTKFYQAYMLPVKFNIDKRKAHLSTLICSDQITREEAIEELKKPLYTSQQEINDELEYVCKKLGFTFDEFQKILLESPRPHTHFKSDLPHKSTYMKVMRKTAKYRKIFKS